MQDPRVLRLKRVYKSRTNGKARGRGPGSCPRPPADARSCAGSIWVRRGASAALSTIFRVCRHGSHRNAQSMGTSTLQRVEVRRARGSTCTHRPYRACPCARFLCGVGRARARARPVPCRLLGLCMQYDATCRLDHVRMTQHAKDYLRERKTNALPYSFTLTGVLCALELVADMPHACDDTCGLAHARMTPQNYECAR